MLKRQHYLLFDLNPHLQDLGEEYLLPGLGAKLSVVRITNYKRIPKNHDPYEGSGKYCLELNARDDQLANEIAQAIYYLSLVFSRGVPVGAEPYAYLIPGELLRGENIKYHELKEFNFSPDCPEPTVDIGPIRVSKSGLSLYYKDIELIAQFVGWVFERGLFDACLYLAGSEEEFYIAPVDVSSIIRDPKYVLDHKPNQKRVESSFLKAYKAVESVMGDPGKDLKKVKKKCKEYKINPDEIVGFLRDKGEVADKIRKLRDIRGEKAGHGRPAGKKKNEVALYELIEMQHLAQFVIQSALGAR